MRPVELGSYQAAMALSNCPKITPSECTIKRAFQGRWVLMRVMEPEQPGGAWRQPRSSWKSRADALYCELSKS